MECNKCVCNGAQRTPEVIVAFEGRNRDTECQVCKNVNENWGGGGGAAMKITIKKIWGDLFCGKKTLCSCRESDVLPVVRQYIN
jgi:hypothetical protein